MVENEFIQGAKTFVGCVTAGGIVLSLILSLSIAYADYAYADTYRSCAKKLREIFKNESRQVFFQGHWGSQYHYYMENEGFTPILDRNIDLVQGDILVHASIDDPALLPHNLKVSSLIYSLLYPRYFPIMTMNIEGKAGFYNHWIGFLPYTISKGQKEEFNVWRCDNNEFPANSSLYYDFIDNIERSKIETLDKSYIVVKHIAIDGRLKRVLFEHPPSKITYRVNLPSMPNLHFSIATDPVSWGKDSDGITFRIIIKTNREIKKVFQKILNPCNNKTERKWNDYSINLSEFSKRNVEIVFETGPGPDEDLRYDWALWANPIIEDKTGLVE